MIRIRRLRWSAGQRLRQRISCNEGPAPAEFYNAPAQNQRNFWQPTSASERTAFNFALMPIDKYFLYISSTSKRNAVVIKET